MDPDALAALRSTVATNSVASSVGVDHPAVSREVTTTPCGSEEYDNVQSK